MAEAYIVSAARTAIGRRRGRLREWHPVDLAAAVMREVVRRADADPARLDDVIVGCVSQVGEQAANIARGAVLAAGFPEHVPATTVDRQCGSSQQAVHFAAQAVMSGTMDMVLAAGVESMTRIPMALAVTLGAEQGYGRPTSPGYKARYPGAEISQFAGAERIALKYELSRDELDRFGYESHLRAGAAIRAGAFDAEILPLTGVDAQGAPAPHDMDEGVRLAPDLDAMKSVPLLRPDGTMTAATASQISDGASGVLVVSEAGLKALGAAPLARIHQMTVLGGDPLMVLEAPIPATELALRRAGMRIDDIGLYEVNEAFASVPLAWLKAAGADPTRLNVNGGAIAIGHPLGASGARLMTTMIHALKARGLRYGLQSMCEGGGLANVTIVEAL